MPTSAELAAYFLGSRRDVVQLELIEIAHPNFSQTYRFVRNCAAGVTVDISATEKAVDFIYYPAKFEGKAARDDLDYSIQISLGDLGEIIPGELDNVRRANGFRTKMAMRYLVYRSDDPTAPIFGPIGLEGSGVDFDGIFSAITAEAPQVNNTTTGQDYLLEAFPMTRGFVT